MRGKTRIVLTAPGGADTYTVQSFKRCSVTSSGAGRASSFGFTLDSFDSDLIDRFPKGSDVKIYQNDADKPEQQTLRGWLSVPGKYRDGVVRTVEFSGTDYTGRTQSIIISESYDGQTIDAVVKDLFAKYVPWATVVNVQTSTKTIKKKFNREYLFDALEFLASIEGWEFFIDFGLDLNFFDPTTRLNPTAISESKMNYAKGTAKFSEDSRLINKLYVRGGTSLSTPYTQTLKGDGVRRSWPLDYKPTNYSMTLNSVPVTSLGLDNVDSGKDYYTNYQEKLLKQDPSKTLLIATDTILATYQYEYPILLLLEDKISQGKYGVFEDKLDVQSDDKELVKAKGTQHIGKYSNPVIKGGIEPLEGFYRAGELVPLDLPTLKVQTALKVTQATYESQPGEFRIRLEMETDYDTRLILKEIRNSIKRLEDQFEEDAPVEQIIGLIEELTLTELLTIRPNNNILETLNLTDTATCTTQTTGTFLVGTAKVGFCDAG
ncbi:MAG: hypothetical protein ACYC3E_00095 [Carboxydocellales bacterium]